MILGRQEEEGRKNRESEISLAQGPAAINGEVLQVSRLVKNVPFFNSLEVSHFIVHVVVGMRTEAKPCS